MVNIIKITDLTAPELAVYTQLTQAQLRSRVAPERALFIAESPKVISTALDAGCQPVSFLMEREKIIGQASALLDRCGDVPVYTADRACLAALTGYTLTRGVLCAMRRPVQPPLSQLLPGTKRLAVLESIVDSTNLGAIFRSAAALGIDAVLLTADCCHALHVAVVETAGGFVVEDNILLCRQCACDGKPLLLPARQRHGMCLPIAPKLHAPQHFFGSGTLFILGQAQPQRHIL